MSTAVDRVNEYLRRAFHADCTMIAEEIVELLNPRPRTIFTEIGALHSGEPIVVGWDTCGACRRHLTRCECEVPQEPSYVTRLRDPEVLEQRYGRSQTPTDVRSQPVPTAAIPVAASGCRDCGKSVTPETADRNDDGSLTCFECQA